MKKFFLLITMICILPFHTVQTMDGSSAPESHQQSYNNSNSDNDSDDELCPLNMGEMFLLCHMFQMQQNCKNYFAFAIVFNILRLFFAQDE